MRTNIRPFLRFAAFFLVLALAIALANTCLIQTDTFVALMMDELKNSRDIELAVVGSSIVRDHFNAALISEQTGRKAFSAAVPGLSLQGELALTRELYRQNSPEYTVLVVEPYNFNTAKEDPNAFFKLSPFLSGVQNRLTYFMDACREDGDYLNRLFLFREFGAQSPADVVKTVALRLNAQREYARLKPTMASTVTYAGGGFLRHTSGESAETLIRETVLREPDPGYPCELFDASRAFLARYKALCAEKGSRLIVVLSPNLTAHALAEPGFLPYGESLMRYCRENDIPCFNFQYAKAEYLQNLDGYYYDLYHMNGTGADLFSAFFARFFNAYTSGEDVSGWFYADQAQYLASIDRITNVWLSVGEGVYIADCNRGTLVTPQYRFVSVAADGTVESGINLAIAQDLDALLRFLGCETRMTRTEDAAIYSDGARTLREKKASDLKNRVALVNETPNAVLLSIHQNSLPASRRVHGAQAFHARTEGSEALAESVQVALNAAVNPGNEKSRKVIDKSVYLMKNISCPAVLVECGFLSNAEEAARLCETDYQRKLAVTVAAGFLAGLAGGQAAA